MIKGGKPTLFYGYVVAASAFFILMIVGGTTYSFGVFFQPLLDEFGWTRAMTSGAFSLYMVLHGCLYIVTGKLTDKYGPRLVVTVCSLFLGSGYLLMSQISAVWQLYLFYGVMVGVGTSGGWVPMLSIVARWFVKKRGMVTGIVASGIGLGTVIMPPAARWLISAYGWRLSYIVMGSVALIVTMVIAQFLKRDPSEMGLVPYGADEAVNERLNSAGEGFSFSKAIRSRQFWAFCLALLGFGYCLQTIMVHIVLYATGFGVSAVIAATILACIGGASVAGRPMMGSAGDRIGNRLAMVICFIAVFAALLWLLIARELWMFYLFAAFFGFAYGGISAVQSPLVAELFGLKSHGVIFGAVTMSIAIGGAIGPVVAGHIFDVTGSYQLDFLICVAVCIMAMVTTLFLRPTNYKGRTNE